MEQWSIPAKMTELPGVLTQILSIVRAHQASDKVEAQIEQAVQEAFSPIALHASANEAGMVTVGCWVIGDPKELFVSFGDQGPKRVASQQVMNRLKKHVDQAKFEYVHGMNVLTLRKGIGRSVDR